MHSSTAVEADLGTGTIPYRNRAYLKGSKGSFFVSLLQSQLLKRKLMGNKSHGHVGEKLGPTRGTCRALGWV